LCGSTAKHSASWVAEPQDLPALEQKKLSVLPTRTIYEFEGAGVAAHPDLPDARACRTISTGSPGRSPM